jgi:CPA1 family monovalent cation:H+ antiporter
METFEWILGLLLGAVALAALARRVGAPYPSFLALAGAGLAFLPFSPDITIDPELALALFIAPVLLDSAFDASVRDLKRNWVPVSFLVFVAVGLTTAAVAFVGHRYGGLPLAAAIALGAIVAPPDAAAASAVLRQLKPPHRLLVVLEGESLFNDATALLVYRLAVGAVAAGTFDPTTVLPLFVLTAFGSVAVAFVLAHVLVGVLNRIDDAPSAIIIQFVTTFGVWLLAERLHLSGIVTVVAYGMIISRLAAPRTSARLRVPAYAVWETAVFVLNVLAFALVGLQLRPILEGLSPDQRQDYLSVAVGVLATVVVVRLGWVVAYDSVLALRNRFAKTPAPGALIAENARGGLVIGWCGMRGIVTLAAAFALPQNFPGRDLILLTAFVVVLGTLVLQGLTLKPLIEALRLSDDDPVARETQEARAAVLQAAVDRLATEDNEVVRTLRRLYEAERDAARQQDAEGSPTRAMKLSILEAQRERLHRMRRSGEIGDDAFHQLEEELDWAEMHAKPPQRA